MLNHGAEPGAPAGTLPAWPPPRGGSAYERPV